MSNSYKVLDSKKKPISGYNYNKEQQRDNNILNWIGYISGGFLLGIASGGSVMTSYYMFAINSPILFTIALAGSVILAVSWGILYSADIGKALIKSFSNTSEQNAAQKVNSRFSKDINLLNWFVPTGGVQENEAKEIEKWVLTAQFNYLMTKIYLGLLQRPSREANAGYGERLDKVYREYEETRAQPASKSYTLIKNILLGSRYTLDPLLDPVLVLDPVIFQAMVINQAKVIDEANLKAWVEYLKYNSAATLMKKVEQHSAEHLKNAPKSFPKHAFANIHFKYANKLKPDSLMQRISVGFIGLLGKLNAIIVNTFGMFFSGINLAGAIFSLGTFFGFSGVLSRGASWIIGGLSAAGGFAGAWFLTRSTGIKAVKKFFKSHRNRDGEELKASKALAAQIKLNRQDSLIKNKLPDAVKATFSLFTGIGFAGFNLTTNMAAMCLMLSPQLINHTDKIFASLFTQVQPASVWVFGGLGAFITAVIVFSFMMKFSYDFEQKSAQASNTGSNHPVTSFWVLASSALNLFVCSVGYFKGTAWSSVFRAIGAPIGVFYTFGLLMMTSVATMCFPVFNTPLITQPLNKAFRSVGSSNLKQTAPRKQLAPQMVVENEPSPSLSR